MAKKNYQRFDTLSYPELTNAGNGEIEIAMRGRNSKGTPIVLKVKIAKYMLPSLVEGFNKIAKADASVAIRFVERLKECIA
jgi:hypothetical protein